MHATRDILAKTERELSQAQARADKLTIQLECPITKACHHGLAAPLPKSCGRPRPRHPCPKSWVVPLLCSRNCTAILKEDHVSVICQGRCGRVCGSNVAESEEAEAARHATPSKAESGIRDSAGRDSVGRDGIAQLHVKVAELTTQLIKEQHQREELESQLYGRRNGYSGPM